MPKAGKIKKMPPSLSPSHIEIMESRFMLSVVVHSAAKHVKLPSGWRATVPVGVNHFLSAADAGSAVPYGLTPDQMRNAYGLGSYGSSSITFNGVQGDGTGQTIAIIDAYDDPNAASDLQNFDAQFGLPNASFTKLNENGGTTLPGTDPAAGGSSGTWEEEESLDIEWAHVMAPGASIVLYEASDASNGLYTAVQTASANSSTSVVSMSWGGGEFSGENSYDSYFTTAGITYVASTGDSGSALEYPAQSPDVVAVGGTSLYLNGNTYGSESAWSDGGGGISTQESRPSYQKNTATGSTSNRATPDVSMDADPSTGVPIYDSFDFGASTPWVPGYEGGTSLAAPLFAGIVAVADQGHVAAGAGELSGRSQVLPDLYSLPTSAFHDITTGSNGHAATTGYDLATGLGSAVANVLIPDLAGTETVTGKAFVDTNGDGVFDGSDIVLANKTVYLDQNNNGVQDSTEPKTTTSSTGIYTFNNVPAGGTVRLSTSSLTGYVAVPPAVIGNVTTNTINVSVFPTSFSTTTASTNYTLQTDSTGANDQILINGSQAYSVAASVISSSAIKFSLTGSGDSFTVNGVNGNPVPTAGITVTGATGGDVLSVAGTASGNDAFTVTSSSISFGSSLISFSKISSLLLNPGTGLDSLAVNSGLVTVTAQTSGSGILTRNFSTLSVASAATALFATAPLHTNRTLVETTGLSVLGKLDLGGNDLIVHSASLTTVAGLIATGFANGAWTGTGIASSAAAADTTHSTALGVIQNTLYGGTGQPLFDGIAPLTTDVLVKFTYYGDTNLDGKVDGSDYSRIDNGYLFASTGWFNGDFNYDGHVDGSDYTLIDNDFNTQGAAL